MMNCLVGICDVDISQKAASSPVNNKIGGTPDWPEGRSIPVPTCRLCCRPQTLVVQLYCCLGESLYNRTLYLLACTNPACWNKSDSWTVYRSQWKSDDLFLQKRSADPSVDKGANEGEDDWGTGDTSWGVDSEDWGEDDMDLVSLVKEPNKQSSGFDAAERKAESEMSGSDVTGACDIEMQQLTIDDVRDDVNDDVVNDHAHGESPSGTAPVLAEDIPELTDKEKSEVLSKLQACGHTPDTRSSEILKSYYISVFDESANEEADSDHVTKLLAEYQRREGCDLQELLDSSRSREGGKGEKYEKSTLLHRDVVFHKFMKRLSSCPQQCVRYEWNGTPLFVSAPHSPLPAHCIHCGGPVVFELQLMPALINHLKLSEGTGNVLEFGTVLIYTCKQSCWSDGDLYRTDQVFVQADPDEHMFKVS